MKMVFHEFIFRLEYWKAGYRQKSPIFAVCLNKALGNVPCDDIESYNETGKS